MAGIITSHKDTLSAVSSGENPVTENAEQENDTQKPERIVIDGEETGEINADDNGIIFPESVIEKAEFQLPGYENIVVEQVIFKEELLSIFNNLKQIEKKDTTPYSNLDGVELNIYCKAGEQNYKVSLATRYNGEQLRSVLHQGMDAHFM